jgi:hypothetical protein
VSDRAPKVTKDEPGPQLTRRQLLGLLGGGAAWLYAPRGLVPRLALPPAPRPCALGAFKGLPPATVPLLPAPQLTISVPVFRREDMLMLVFYGYNLLLDTGGSEAVLRRGDNAEEAYLVVRFPPQALLEAAVPVAGTTPPSPWPDPPLPALLAGPSQLAFALRASVDTVPFTVEGLLGWAAFSFQWETSPFTGSAPPDLATYIEAPARLFLSPDGSASWSHSSSPLTYNGRTELWQTRLGANGTEPPRSSPPLRAVWTPAFPQGLPDPFEPSYAPSLYNTDRLDLIALTCGTTGSSTPAAVALPALPSVPAQAQLFMLTALGATMNVHGSWDTPPVSTLTDWRHRMVTGRESYVRTVRAGYLFPFGHRAVHIIVTDREFQVDGNGDVVAYLVQRQYVVVVQPTRNYAAAAAEPYAGRQNPLRQVTVTTLATPPIDAASPAIAVGNFPLPPDDNEVFWVQVDGADYPFAHTGSDLEGRAVQVQTGAIFVSEKVALDGYNGSSPSATAQQISGAYANVDASRRSPSLGGQLVAFADPGGKPGSTAQHVGSVGLGGASPQGRLAPLEPPFFPVVEVATVRLPGAEQIRGAGLSDVAVAISHNYYQANFAPGVPEVYLELASGTSPVPLGFSPQISGGVATPNFGITGLARDLGPVAGPIGDLLAGKFDPANFFASVSGLLEAKLLGAISLSDIIASAGLSGSPAGTSAGGQAPTIQSSLVYPGNDTTQPPAALQTTLDWSPQIKGDPLGFFVPGSGATLAVHAKVYTPIKSPAQTTYSVNGSLSGFHLVLFGNAAPAVDVAFKGLSFSFATGAKAQLRPDISGVTFIGPLSFVQAFEQFFASPGGPSVNVSSAGVQASYSVAIPSVSVGVFSLSNLALSGVLNIPFDSSPVRFRVSLCTRENPFLLSIDLFTGGGFFGMALGADGIEMMEASLEFGASTSIDLGVASGGISVMAGIYFMLQTTPSNAVQLTGFFRADGNLSVLGIVSISVEFYLGLTYLNPGQAYGTATVTVEVSVLCFSKSVSMTMQKTIGGGDPSFAAAITEGDWKEYCLAFAA